MQSARLLFLLPLLARAVLVTTVAHADALPGRFEADGGAHFMALAHERCSFGFPVDVSDRSCAGFPLFVGFDLGFRSTLGPEWFALGLRASGSKELNPESGQPFAQCTLTSSVCLPTSLDRDLWLFRAAVEVRFDPPIWPRALWASIEIGAAIAIATGHYSDPRAAFLNRAGPLADPEQRASDPPVRAKVGFLGGIGVGWDFWLSEPVVFGMDVRVQIALVSANGSPRANELDINLRGAPYLALGAHAGYRWK